MEPPSELSGALVFTDTCSSIKSRGIGLRTAIGHRHRLLLAAGFLVVSRLAFTGALAEVPEEDRLLLDPSAGVQAGIAALECGPIDELLAQAAALIAERRYDEAGLILADVVECDEEQLPAAQTLFQEIRAARLAYVEKGTEVVAALDELLSDIAPEDVVRVALDAFALIDEMSDILPFPNESELAQQDELRTRILLTIDQQRFNQIMIAGLEQLQASDFVGAVRTYIEGLGDYGFDIAVNAQPNADGSESAAQRISTQLNDTDGLRLQILDFDPNDYELTGPAFEAARDDVRAAALDEAESFVQVAETVTAAANAMIESFEAGQFADATAQIDSFVPLLEAITSVYQRTVSNAEIIDNQEQINNQLAVQDSSYRRNYHIAFAAQLTNGRPATEEPEGILAAIRSVWDLAANGPVVAARRYGDDRFAAALDLIEAFSWTDLSSPANDLVVDAHTESVVALLDQAIDSYRTALRFTQISRGQELALDGISVVSADDAYEGSSNVLASLNTLPADAAPDALREATLRIAAADYLSRVTSIAAEAYDVGLPIASTSNVIALNNQRSRISALRDTLVGGRANWLEFINASGLPADILSSVDELLPYSDALLALAEGYERDVAIQVAQIEVRADEQRLASFRTVLTLAQNDLNRTDAASGLARPLTASARDRLQPLVGSVSGVRVISTASGDLQDLATSSSQIQSTLSNEVPYIESDPTIQSLALRAGSVSTAIVSTPNGLLATARSRLEQALVQIDRAVSLANEAFQRVNEADSLLQQASAAAGAGNILGAAEELTTVENLISADPRSASRLIAESLEEWDRPEIEDRWLSEQERLLALLQQIRVDIVFVRVDTLIEEAGQLLQSTGITEPQPRLAGIRLDEAEDLWFEVSPTASNPTISELRRQADLLVLGSSKELNETSPDFVVLTNLLNQASVAFEAENYQTATEALDIFLREQPNNERGRLLEIRIGLAETRTGNQSSDQVVRLFLDRSLDEATPDTESDENIVRAFLSNEDQPLDGLTFGTQAFFELDTRLEAILTIVDEGDVSISSFLRSDIVELRDQIDLKLNPPPPVVVVGLSNEQIAAQIVSGISGTQFGTLPEAQLTTVRDELLRALALDPNNAEARRLVQLVLIELPQPITPPDVQAVLDSASERLQVGDTDGALAIIESYEGENPAVVQIPDWIEFVDDLNRRRRGR